MGRVRRLQEVYQQGAAREQSPRPHCRPLARGRRVRSSDAERSLSQSDREVRRAARKLPAGRGGVTRHTEARYESGSGNEGQHWDESDVLSSSTIRSSKRKK